MENQTVARSGFSPVASGLEKALLAGYWQSGRAVRELNLQCWVPKFQDIMAFLKMAYLLLRAFSLVHRKYSFVIIGIV